MKFLPLFLGFVSAQDMSTLTDALTQSENEIRTGIFPIVTGIIAAILVVAIAVSVVWVIVKN